jgi:uncharacterized protein YbbC (DUF1343 family)
MLAEENSSFIGRWDIPIRHSCTLGELARYFNDTHRIGVDLEIIPCKGWNRMSFQTEWGTTFVPPSPAIQRFETTVLYPGLCLLEATNVSEGRGTDDPFTRLGAPWLDAPALARRLHDLEMDEVDAELIEFIPNSGRYSGQICKGLQFSVHNKSYFQPVFWGCLVIKLIKDLHPGEFSWEPYPTLANPSGKNHLNRLLGPVGSENIFDLPMASFLTHITRLTRVSSWNSEISKYLLY